jgi:glucan-binding YG repeat protein
MFTGWKKFGNYMRYFATDGVMATGLTKATNGNWYYFNNSGIRQYGWVAFGKNYRYFDPSTGVMLANTKQTIGGKNYTFGANGICTNK